LSDDIVSRLALVVTELACLVDKLSRNEGIQRLIELLGNEEVQTTLIDVLNAASAAKKEAAALPPSGGGIGGMLKTMTDPATQDALRFVALVSKHLK